MIAGRKAKPEKILPTLQSHQLAAPGSGAVSLKPGETGHSSGFAPGTYYRQGVLVPGGPHKFSTARGKSR